MSNRSERRTVAAIVGLTALLRVGLVWVISDTHPERMIVNDTAQYTGPALSLVHDGDFDRSHETSTPEFQRTPGYPAFVATIYWVTGDSNTAVVVVQAALSSLSVLLAIMLARRLTGSPVVAIATGVLVALDPQATGAAGLLVTETLATVLVMLVAYCGVRMAQSRCSPRWALATGVALAGATYVRPTTYYFPIVLLGVLGVVALQGRLSRAELTRAALALVLPCIALLGAWHVHNRAEVGSWRFSSIDATNLYWYRAAAVIAERDGIDREAAQVKLTARLIGEDAADNLDDEDYSGGAPPPGWEHRQGEYYARAQREALEILRDEPALTAREVFRSFYGQFVQSGWATSARYLIGRAPPVAALGLPYIWGMQALAIFGAAVTLRRRNAQHRFAHVTALSLIVYTVMVSTIGSDAANGFRMRIPVWPIWCLYAVLGARELVAILRDRRSTDSSAPSREAVGAHL